MDLERINELGFEKTSKWMKIVLIVSFSRWWNLLIALQCYIIFFMCTSCLAFRYINEDVVVIHYIFDLFYFFEIIFTISFRTNAKYKKLRHGFGRSWVFIFIDIISVLPTELFYTYHYVSNNKQENQVFVSGMLLQNRVLRIYRIFQLETLYDMIVRKCSHYVLFMVLLFLSKALLISHILTCIWVNIKQTVTCDPDKFVCFLWYEVHMAKLVILNWNGQKSMFGTDGEHVLVSLAMLAGLILIYAYFYPLSLLVSLQLHYGQTCYYDKYRKLMAFLNNMVRRADVRSKILENFLDAWQSTDDIQLYLENVPLAMKKEIFTDIYWDAFRHSELLRSLTRNCKRSLSLTMKTNYYHSGEIVYTKGQHKSMMLYLVQGIVEIMAEENEKSPLLSFSNGTVFGELSLFLHIHSQAIVKCKSYCEFQTLSMESTMSVLKDYPKDNKYIKRRLQQRILMARYTQWRKNEFRVRKNGRFGQESNLEDCVKWVKTQWSTVWEGHKRQQMIIKAVEEGQRIPGFHRVTLPDIKLEFVSNYLELFVLSDAFEEKRDAVCLKMNFPWSIDPSASFLKVWNKFILFVCFVPNILYPICTAWLVTFPKEVFEFSFVVTLLFQVDLLLQLFTAIKTKHLIHTKFVEIFKHKLRQPTFYLDVLAAFPYQMFFMLNEDYPKTHEAGFLLHPAILKSHLLLRLSIPSGPNMDKVTLFKNCIIFIFLLYWLSEFVQYLFVLKKYQGDTWINNFLQGRESRILRKYLISVLNALTMAVGIPDYLMYGERTLTVLVNCFFKFAFFLFFTFFLITFYGSYVVRIYSQESFLMLLKRIIKFLNSVQLNRKLAERLLKTVKFQWSYDNADNLLSDVPIMQAAPFDIRNTIYNESVYKTLRICKMFENETVECLAAVMDRSIIVAVPAGSLLVSFGHTSHMISIIHRGVCQINSFLGKDTVAGVGWPVVVSSGAAFPMLSCLCNVPAPVGVVSVTDCELIMIHLDDLLKILIDFNILKDVLDVLKELDLLKRMNDVKPGLVMLRDKSMTNILNEKIVTKKKRRLRFFISLFNLFFRGSRFSDMKFVRQWEAVFTIYIITFSLMWPNCFGLLIYYADILLPLLISTKVLTVFNFFVGCRCPYYNKIGILVTHPLHTLLNYLFSSFIVDFFCFFPIYELYRFMWINSLSTSPIWIVFISFFQLYMKIMHLLGYVDTMKNIINNMYVVRMLKLFFCVFIAFNMFINFMMFVLADWTLSAPYKIVSFTLPEKYLPKYPNLLRNNSLWDYYIFTCYWMLTNLNTTEFGLNKPNDIQLYAGYALSVIGTILQIYVYSLIASNSFFTYLGETVFHEKIISFAKFLEMENANDKVTEHALSYYNHEWSNTRGENLKKTFERLPTHLHEELVYPLYRSTLRKSEVFSHADEGFYKILCKHISSVYFNRGSVIIFQREVQSDLYFIHKGKCFVYDWFVKLESGSLIGDLKRTGVMENKIYALTNVELLRISSNDFFMVINNFENLEKSYLRLVTTMENFLQAKTSTRNFQLHPVDSKDVLNAFGLQERIIGFEDESYFEETDKSSIFMRKKLKYKVDEKKRIFTIYPDTWKMKLYVGLLQVDACVTIIVIPYLTIFGGLTKEAFLVFAVLDFFWLIGIILSFRVGYIDKIKGDVITDFKFVAKHYVKRWDGFILDLLALLPIELVYVAIVHDLKEVNHNWVSLLRSLRLLRVSCLMRNLQVEWKKFKRNHYLTYVHLVMYLIIGVVMMSAVTVIISTNPVATQVANPYFLTTKQFFLLVESFEYVLTCISSANLHSFVPSTQRQLMFSIFLGVVSPYIKGIIMTRVLSIIHAKGLAQFNYKSEVVALESYLVSKDTSPILVSSVLEYKFNLLEFGRSESMPTFLVKSPTSIRISIMRDLYLVHLKKCPLFQSVNTDFLEQLLARMTREIYFSGQVIVEQYDVDHRMYFIHKGEVYVINQTKDKAYLEFVVGRMYEGDYFGDASGLWFSKPQSFTYRARTLVEVIVLHCDDWMDLRRSFPETAELILKKARTLRII
ncbi:hypothetical protein RUM44_001413 [Polyplax serrata]|uniref:Cyclic nucleotide-binding domain-containing protein n=1 Tax=Polyplax serrata TaxID=468196 RepID=A0ABR1AK07_POLSC